MKREEVERQIVTLARRFGAQSACSDSHIYRDLSISGGDAVEFYREIEKVFGVDITPITESVIDVDATRFRKARKKKVARDPSIYEISSFIAENGNE